jgi:IclR family pca regulon transcriptional regulator
MVILNESLRRGLDLLRAFSRLRNPGLRHLAEATGMAKATTLRYLRTLEEEGYVAIDPATKVYRLTPLVFELGHAALVSMAFPKLAEPYMDQLATDLNVTVNLARLDNVEIVMMGRAFTLQDKFTPTPIRIDVGARSYFAGRGRRQPGAMPCGSAGATHVANPDDTPTIDTCGAASRPPGLCHRQR